MLIPIIRILQEVLALATFQRLPAADRGRNDWRRRAKSGRRHNAR